jgi:hypothetical protein
MFEVDQVEHHVSTPPSFPSLPSSPLPSPRIIISDSEQGFDMMDEYST